MQIGNVTINGKLALAPMAGVTDLAFRHICREQRRGADRDRNGLRKGAVL